MCQTFWMKSHDLLNPLLCGGITGNVSKQQSYRRELCVRPWCELLVGPWRELQRRGVSCVVRRHNYIDSDSDIDCDSDIDSDSDSDRDSDSDSVRAP